MKTINVNNANNHSGFHLNVLKQPPDDVFVLSLIPRDVVERQSIACCRRRSKACVAINGEVVSMRSPTPACRGLCLQGASVAILVHAVAGNVDNVFIVEFQSFFFADINMACCCAPVGPHVAIPEKK